MSNEINLAIPNIYDQIYNLEQKVDDLVKTEKRPSIKYKGKALGIKKPFINPKFLTKSVLTDNLWRYVDIYLKGESNSKPYRNARKYWEQARQFHIASKYLTEVSLTVTTYYCFLNAVKALLISKKSDNWKKPYHGVCRSKEDYSGWSLSNDEFIIKKDGVLPCLCNYLGEPAGNHEYKYNLKQALFNIPYIHRAYCLTYTGAPDIFIPIYNPRFVFNRKTKKAWLEAELETQQSNNRTLKKLKKFVKDDSYQKDNYVIKSVQELNNVKTQSLKYTPIENFKNYHNDIRKCLEYIHGPIDLWYVKNCNVKDSINRSSLTLTFAAMHYLSELARYDPDRLETHLSGKSHWLISEFINNSMNQFIDQISSEITGCDIRIPGIRL